MLTQIAFGFHGYQTNKSVTSRTQQALSIATMEISNHDNRGVTQSLTQLLMSRVFYEVDIR